MRTYSARAKHRVNLASAIWLLLLVLYAVFGTSFLRAGKINASPVLLIGNCSLKPGPSPELSISLNGNNPFHHECGDSFEDPGATAVNSMGESVPVKVSGTVNVNVLGSYTLTYTAVDDARSVTIERTVVVADGTPPVITLRGSNPMALGCGETFEDPGSSALDVCDREVPVVVSGTVNSNITGTYTIAYTATDSHGNRRTVERRILVGSLEEDPPTINVKGAMEMTIECGNSFIDSGATASTPCSGAVHVEVSGTVDVRTPGDYVVKYEAVLGESKAEKARLVSIVDTTPPIISLQGDNPMVIELNQRFIDLGATALDGCAGSFAAEASGTVNPNTVGSYVVTYTARDPSGNEAIPVTRSVKVVERRPPGSLTFSLFPTLVQPAPALRGYSIGVNSTPKVFLNGREVPLESLSIDSLRGLIKRQVDDNK